MYKLKILVNNIYEEVDLTSAFSLNFNYQIRDFEEPAKIRSAFSKTVNIIGTPHNLQLLGYISELGTDYSLFNPGKKLNYTLSYNGMVVSTGFMTINKISNNNNNIVFGCTLFDATSMLLYDMKYNSNGDEITLADLTLGEYVDNEFKYYEDQNILYKYDTEYTLDSWSLLHNNRINGPYGETWEYHPSIQTIKSFITPIYCNTGLYEDFTSNKILLHRANNNGGFVYDPLLQRYTDERKKLYNIDYSIKDGDKTFQAYKNWILIETERDLHPSEINTIVPNRLPLGVNMLKLWDNIKVNFNVDDTEVRDYLHDYMQNTFIVLDNNLEKRVESTGEPITLVQPTSIDNNIDDENRFNIFGLKELQFTNKVTYNAHKDNTLNIELDQAFNTRIPADILKNNKSKSLKISTNVLCNSTVIPTSWFSPGQQGGTLAAAHTEPPFPPYSNEWINFSTNKLTSETQYTPIEGETYYNERGKINTNEYIVYVPVILYCIEFKTNITTTKEYIACYDKNISKEFERYTHTFTINDVKKIVERGVTQVIRDIDYTLTLEPVDIIRNDLSKETIELYVKDNINKEYNFTEDTEVSLAYKTMTIALPNTDYVNDKLSDVTIPHINTPIYEPTLRYIKGYESAGLFINYQGLKEGDPDEFLQNILKIRSGYLANDSIIEKTIKWDILDNTHIVETNIKYEIDDFQNTQEYYKGRIKLMNNRCIREYDNYPILDGLFFRSQEIFNDSIYALYNLEEVDVRTIVKFDENIDTVGNYVINKDILKDVKIIDVFTNICKTFNLNVITDNTLETPKLKVVRGLDLYNSDKVIDLTNMVNKTSISITPNIIESQTYKYALDTTESYADYLVRVKYSDYNVKAVTYDYDINNEPIEVLEKVDFLTAMPYTLNSVYFNSDNILDDRYNACNKGNKFTETLFYNDISDTNSSKSIEKHGLGYKLASRNVQYLTQPDVEPKLCFFDKKLENIEWKNTLVCYRGFFDRLTTPPLTLENEIPATQQLAGESCYYIVDRCVDKSLRDVIHRNINFDEVTNNDYFQIVQTPQFSNYIGGHILGFTDLDNTYSTDNIYTNFFEGYNSVFYSIHNKSFKAKVKLDSYSIYSILRSVYYYNNAYWVINKINNFDYSKELNECEFVQINYQALKQLQGK